MGWILNAADKETAFTYLTSGWAMAVESKGSMARTADIIVLLEDRYPSEEDADGVVLEPLLDALRGDWRVEGLGELVALAKEAAMDGKDRQVSENRQPVPPTSLLSLVVDFVSVPREPSDLEDYWAMRATHVDGLGQVGA